MTRPDRPRRWFCLPAFLLPAALLTLAYALEGFAPFGDQSILTSDMSSQYVEFFCSLKQGDVFFSWSKALGSSYIGVFSYYLSSPLSLLTLLVPNECMPVGLLWLTVLKFGLAGLTAFLFFSRRFPCRGAAALLCSACYAMCAYSVAYSTCIMWLDGVIWLPVILLGLDRLLDGGRRWPFACALAACFLSTWYISYMIGGFCCLWFLAQAVIRRISPREALRRLGSFLLCALWALCLTAWLWLPTLLSMSGGKFSIPLTDYSGLVNFSLPQLLGQLLPGRFQPFSENLPFVFCGTLTVAGFGAWFFLRGVPTREKLAWGGLALALVLSLWLSPLDRVWHLFKYPNFFFYRYSFLLSFVLILPAGQALDRGLAWLEGRGPGRLAAPWLSLVLAAAVCAELTCNAAATFRRVADTQGYASYSDYQHYYAANAALVDRAEELSEGDGFYRMGAAQDRGLNAPLSFGYHGITHYSSFFDSQVNAALKSLGFAQSWYWSAYYGSTPLTDALFSVRYVLSEQPEPDRYAALDSRDGLTLYENPTVLPLAFAANRETLSLELSSGDPFQNQNQLFSALSGLDEPLWTAVTPTSMVEESGGAVTLTFQGTGQPIYANLSASGLSDLWVNGSFRASLSTSETRCVHYLGTPAPGETLTAVIRCSSLQEWSGRFCVLDEALLSSGLSALAGGSQPQVDGSTVRLELTGAQAGAVVTTIPAQDGWSVWVDGQRVEPGSFLDAFLAVEVPAGSHTLLLRYDPPGLALALALGGAALLASLLLLLRRGAMGPRP